MHFITCSCHRRLPLFRDAEARDLFLKILGEVRAKYRFGLVGYVVMPEHVHLLITDPEIGTPADVMQVLKQRVAKVMRKAGSFWQTRFYDFNVWTLKKRAEKIGYIHMNPVKRGLVDHPKDWKWSSYGCYAGKGDVLIEVDWVG